jgi:hypothetical protein
LRRNIKAVKENLQVSGIVMSVALGTSRSVALVKVPHLEAGLGGVDVIHL